MRGFLMTVCRGSTCLLSLDDEDTQRIEQQQLRVCHRLCVAYIAMCHFVKTHFSKEPATVCRISTHLLKARDGLESSKPLSEKNSCHGRLRASV